MATATNAMKAGRRPKTPRTKVIWALTAFAAFNGMAADLPPSPERLKEIRQGDPLTLEELKEISQRAGRSFQGASSVVVTQLPFRDCPKCPEMLLVPASSYRLGSRRDDDEGRPREVTFSAPFALGAHEVTVAEFGRFVDETGYSAGSSCRTYEGGRQREHGLRVGPVPPREQRGRKRGGTLPGLTVASCRDGHGHTAPMGSLVANSWGLHDMRATCGSGRRTAGTATPKDRLPTEARGSPGVAPSSPLARISGIKRVFGTRIWTTSSWAFATTSTTWQSLCGAANQVPKAARQDRLLAIAPG